jgi:hypothetical protein
LAKIWRRVGEDPCLGFSVYSPFDSWLFDFFSEYYGWPSRNWDWLRFVTFLIFRSLLLPGGGFPGVALMVDWSWKNWVCPGQSITISFTPLIV